MYFPLELPLGKHVPLYGSIPGRSFRLRRHPETTSQSERRFRDALSAWAAIGNARLTLHCRSAFFTPAPCIEFYSPRFGGSVDGLSPGQDARSASHLYLAGALRGESAYLLRKYAPASAACRRPRPLATNASRLFNARALHRVRFSAVSIGNKKAGRDTSLPACNCWWRRGESNSGPRKPPDWHLQAQSLVLSRTLCAQRHARGVLTGSVLACVIPITCAGAFP